MDALPTLQDAVVARLKGTVLTTPEPGGLGFGDVWPKWLVETGPGAEPDAFTTGGRIKPNIVVLEGDRNPHPSVTVPGWSKWDQFVTVYLFHYPGTHGKTVLARAELAVEDLLTAEPFHIVGGQRPSVAPGPNVQVIDDPEQFSGNYVKVLRFRVTGLRSVPIA